MIKKTVLALICILVFVSIGAYSSTDIKYPASEIPAGLKENANAVIRKSDVTYTILDLGHASYIEHKVITILNKSADRRADFVKFYSKLDKILNYNMYLYDATGKLIKKVKQSEFKDYSAVPEMSLYSDDRVIAYQPMVNTYPYTVEYTVEYDDFNEMGYPYWIPQNKFDISVESASIKLIVPKGFKFHYRARNLTDSMQLTEVGKNSEYFWKTENLKAMDVEPYCKEIEEVVPNVILVPSDFKLGAYQGNFDSWQSFGKFIYNMSKSKNTLSEKTVQEINSIVQNNLDKKQQVKLLYEYMQNKTRYINVSIGIGGWKPFDASVVDNLGYGDCKALSNYMKTILDTAGILSYYTLILAGDNESDIDTVFPHNQFDHAIVCVPMQKDTLWLECTSQKNPFNFQGSFTSNRHALVITPEGGKLFHTHTLSTKDNMQVRKAEVTLDETGNGTAQVNTIFTGIQFDSREEYFYADPDEQKKALLENLDIANFKINKWNYTIDKDSTPSISEILQLQLENYTTTSGKRVFLPLNLMEKSNSLPISVKNRKTSFIFNWSYMDIDTVIYNVPVNYKPEYLPEIKEIQSEFGSYSASVKSEGNKLIYIRIFKRNNGLYPASKYNDYIEFRKKIITADNLKISLIKTEV
jgi:hypothetical protein